MIVWISAGNGNVARERSGAFGAVHVQDAAERLDAILEPAEAGGLLRPHSTHAPPIPSSRTTTVSVPFSCTALSQIRDACACLTVLVAASAQT